MKKSISWKFVLGAFCSALLLGIGSQARAHNDGAIMWSKNGQPRGEGGHSWITYPSYQGAQGTHWVWRIQKYYPEFTVFCSTGHPSGCQANKTEGRFEQVMTQLTFKMELSTLFLSRIFLTAKELFSLLIPQRPSRMLLTDQNKLRFL